MTRFFDTNLSSFNVLRIITFRFSRLRENSAEKKVRDFQSVTRAFLMKKCNHLPAYGAFYLIKRRSIAFLTVTSSHQITLEITKTLRENLNKEYIDYIARFISLKVRDLSGVIANWTQLLYLMTSSLNYQERDCVHVIVLIESLTALNV